VAITLTDDFCCMSKVVRVREGRMRLGSDHALSMSDSEGPRGRRLLRRSEDSSKGKRVNQHRERQSVTLGVLTRHRKGGAPLIIIEATILRTVV